MNSRSCSNLARRALLSGAAVGSILTAAAPATGFAAEAEVQELVVTGTAIRGVAPVGANVISVGREQIQETGAQTVQQLLTAVPQVTGFNNIGQGGFGSADGSGTNAPTIHSLGASASNSTLVLIDGHRFPLSGLDHTLADPSVIAPLALERVEVLPDGSSAVYGSDAVAGVLNFITRRRYDGLETAAQVGFADGGYKTATAGFVWGSVWDTGSALLAYGYSHRSSLRESEREFIRTDLRPLGGTNFGNFACDVAVVQPAAGQPGAGQRFQAPYALNSGTTNFQANPCDPRDYFDAQLVPEEMRHSVLGKFEQKFGERLTASVDLVYSQRLNKQNSARGGAVNGVTVYGPGSTPPGGAGQINPFFRGPTGVNRETVFFNFDSLLPGGTRDKTGAEAKFITIGLEYEMGRDWIAELGGTFGQDDSFSRSEGGICVACVQLALNGTVNNAGTPTTPAGVGILGTTTLVTRLPLTTANALDIWSAPGQNRTSPEVLLSLLDSKSFETSRQNIENVKFTMGGPLFTLPGGDIRVSLGAEGIRYSLRQFVTGSAVIGPASQNSRFTQIDYSRNVHAFFGETVVPIVGDDNALPFLQRLDLSGAVRYDHYSDFGSTTNPKIAFTMETVPGLSFRGSYGTAFTAPALTSRGNENGQTSQSRFSATGDTVVPNSFPGITSLPGCNPIPATGCRIGGNNVAQGITLFGGNKDAKPATGETWSIGSDFRPSFLPGFRASITYWTAKYNGLISAPGFDVISRNPPLYNLFTINPTPAQVAEATRFLRQESALPARIDFIISQQQTNVFNLDAAGLDYDASYRLGTESLGDFTFSVAISQKTKFNQRSSDAVPWDDRLNVSGIGTFSTIKLTGRASINWRKDGWTAGLAANYTNPYWRRDNNNITVFGAQGQRVSSYTTFDLNGSYEFQNTEGLLNGLELTWNIRNVLDKNPPYVNINGGYNSQESNPIGRLITVGVRKEW